MQLDALAKLDADTVEAASTICLFNEDWHQGVVGLVASRVKEKFHRPTIAFARASESELRGSGRSIEGVHLRDTLDLVTKQAPDLVRRFGGHAMAAGLTLQSEHYDRFARAFEDATRASCDRALFARTVATDGPLKPDEIGLPLINALDQHVWGQGFPPPLFANVFTVLDQRLIKDRHLKLDARPRRPAVQRDLVPPHRAAAEGSPARVSPGGGRLQRDAPGAADRRTRRLPIIRGFRAGKTMEAERLNQIEGTVADLRGRLAELRRYL